MTKKTPSLKNQFNKLAGQMLLQFINQQRMKQPRDPYDYVLFTLPGAMPTFTEPRNVIQQRLLGRNPMSLYGFTQALTKLADMNHVKGIILNIPGLTMGLADLQTMRDALVNFRKGGKRVIAYSQTYDLASYFLASAADEIWLQEGGAFMTVGLVQQQVFLKDALDTIGVTADVVAISPFKSAADQLSRSEPSEESRDQVNWLLDSQYSIFIDAIAQGRGMTTDGVHAMINSTPATDLEALEAGYIQQITQQERFSALLDDATLTTWEKVEGHLPIEFPFDEEQIVILPFTGMIVNGTSANPPVDIPLPLVGGPRIGDVTAVGQIRELMTNDSVKAVVLYIDSPGGSATASEAIHSALTELAKTRPVIAVMGRVAASGGYYIATPAEHIIAQPGTITGSIGVVLAKLVTNDMLRKLRFNPFTYLRGENATVFTSVAPFTEAQREKMRSSIERIYDLFLKRVTDSRKLKREQVDAIGGGRVWTGQQALDNGLVDELGGIEAGIARARKLANLPSTTPVRLYLHKPRQPMVAQVAEKVNPAAALNYWMGGLETLTSGQVLTITDYEWR